MREKLLRTDSRYDDCPKVCGQTKEVTNKFCDGCPMLKMDKRFHKETLSALKKRVGENWDKHYSLDSVLDSVFAVMEIEADDDDSYWHIGTEILVNILRQERNKIVKADHQKMLGNLNPQGKRDNGGE